MVRRLTTLGNVALLIVILVITAACRGTVNETFSTIGSGLSGEVELYSASLAATPAAGAAGDYSGGHVAASTGEPGESEGLTSSDPPAASAAPRKEVAGSTSGSGSDSLNVGTVAPPDYQSPLTAGQVDDNARFGDYVNYIRGYQGPNVQPIGVEQRLFVRVVDKDQKPVASARVQLFDGDRQVFDGRTVSDGRVLFFPQDAGATQAQQLRAIVSRGQQQVEATLPVSTDEQTVHLDVIDNTGPVAIDLVFLLDATGSMGDEINHIKATIDTIASRIAQLPGSSAPRLGLVAYRDREDAYVTRKWDFTDVQGFSNNLSSVDANGGGDYPEAVNAGLYDAIHLPGWADANSGRHLRLIVMVGDAPPHLDYENDHEYPQLLREAVARGIKIFPIGASELDDQGEYIFRQFAQVTQGQFVFLTYANGVSGAPGPATTHSVSDFTVRNLDTLVVNLVANEIANQTGQRIESTDLPYVPSTTAVPTKPIDQGLLATLVGAVTSTFNQVMDNGGMIWALLLVALLAWARKGQRARVATSAPLTFSIPSADDEPDLAAPERVPARLYDREQAAAFAYYRSRPLGQHTVRLRTRPRSVPVAHVAQNEQ